MDILILIVILIADSDPLILQSPLRFTYHHSVLSLDGNVGMWKTQKIKRSKRAEKEGMTQASPKW